MGTTVGSTALLVAILYVLSRWALASVEHAVLHPGKGRPEITWKVTWCIALVVSALGACSVHVWLLEGSLPTWQPMVFNGLIFGGFFLGFFVSGHYDHKVRLGL